MAQAERPSLASLPDLMDVDFNADLPEDLFEFDNQFLDEYLKRVRGADDKGTSMLLPSIDLDDPLLPPQAPSVGLASHSTSAGSHPSGHLAAGQVFAAPSSADANIPASNQFVPGAAVVPLIAQPHTAQPQQVFSVPGPHDQDLAPPQSAAHSAAYEEVDGSDAPAVHSSGTAGSARAKKGATGPRKATPQRKQNNRKAQQRYREKRKMQAVEREEQVKLLSAQLATMQELQEQNQKHASENDELRSQLQEKQGEIEALRKMMEAGFIDLGARSHSEHSSEGRNGFRVDSGGDGGGGDSPMAREERPVTQPQHARLTHDDAAARLKQLVGEMRALLEAHGLPGTSYLRGDPRYSDPALAAALRPLAQHVDRLSMQRLLTAPAKPQERSKCDSSRFASAHPCALFRARWTGALEAMGVSEEQVDTLLAARAQTLERLRALYEERAELNNMTMAIMLPRPAPESFYDGSTARKLELMGQFGGKCALSHSQQLAEALDEIRENLRQEQRIMVQLHSVLVLKVLSPAQAAVMFTLADDELVEPLHITNIAALNRGVIQLLPMCRGEVGDGAAVCKVEAEEPAGSTSAAATHMAAPPATAAAT